MTTTPPEIEIDDLENMLLCAHWLIEEFEKMNLYSPAKIFQGALDDSVAWLNTMSEQDNELQKYSANVHIREAQIIREILVKYASIQNPEKRERALQKMRLATKASTE